MLFLVVAALHRVAFILPGPERVRLNGLLFRREVVGVRDGASRTSPGGERFRPKGQFGVPGWPFRLASPIALPSCPYSTISCP